jgi:hypothetical protein
MVVAARRVVVRAAGMAPAACTPVIAATAVNVATIKTTTLTRTGTALARPKFALAVCILAATRSHGELRAIVVRATEMPTGPSAAEMAARALMLGR